MGATTQVFVAAVLLLGAGCGESAPSQGAHASAEVQDPEDSAGQDEEREHADDQDGVAADAGCGPMPSLRTGPLEPIEFTVEEVASDMNPLVGHVLRVFTRLGGIDLIETGRKLYRDGVLVENCTGSAVELDAPLERPTDGEPAFLASIPFPLPSLVEDGYYAEIIEVAGRDAATGYSYRTQRRVHYRVAGAEVATLTRQEYNDMTTTWIRGVNAAGECEWYVEAGAVQADGSGQPPPEVVECGETGAATD